MLVHGCKTNTQEAEASELRMQSQPGLRNMT